MQVPCQLRQYRAARTNIKGIKGEVDICSTPSRGDYFFQHVLLNDVGWVVKPGGGSSSNDLRPSKT